MDLIQLNKVAEIIGKLGDKTIDGLIAYLGFNFAIELIGYSVGVICIIAGYKLLRPISDLVGLNTRAVNCLKDLRVILGVGSEGALIDSEIEMIYDKVIALTNSNKAEKQ